MADDSSYKDVPPRVMEVLRTFLAASLRGEVATLVLETRNKALSTKYSNVEKSETTGTPAVSSSLDVLRKKKNPSRVRRSMLRMKKFLEMKDVDSLKQSVACSSEQQAAGDLVADHVLEQTSNTSNQLVLELVKEEVTPVGAGQAGTIPQVDGEGKDVRDVIFAFSSDYGEEDIIYTLDQVFKDVPVSLVSRKRVSKMKAEHLCTAAISVDPAEKEEFSWPKMKPYDAEVFTDLKRIQ